MPSTIPVALTITLYAIGTASTTAAESPTYNRDIRPILAENCFACHGADSAAREADLRLDQRDAALESGAITAGKIDESELVARIMSSDPDLVMPPPSTKKQLSNAEKERLRQWIAAGAAYEAHWSLIVPTTPQIPIAKNAAWPKNAIDRFVLAQLEKHNLQPAVEATPRTLFRRIHLDITGLPPTPDLTSAFVADYKSRGDDALSEWIDRLMDAPEWGEHRARYWLDAARYADTHGLHFDNYREMWPYRDWVIRAFNSNQPFDRFVVEQLAGDLLPNATDDQRVATGFQRCNMTTNEGGTIADENLANYAADRVQTFGWVFLGLTTNCGQCHDHKFDPITTKDYYSLAAFFRNTTQGAMDGNVKDGRGPVISVPSPEDRERWLTLTQELRQTQDALLARRKAARPGFEKWLAATNGDDLQKQVTSDGLLVHLPLNEGTGDVAKNTVAGPGEFPATGTVTWDIKGKIGPAPVLRLGATFDLGQVGDFEKDQAFSVGAWVKTAREASGGIIARMDENQNYRGWDLWQNGGGFSVHIIDTWPSNAIKVTTKDNVVRPGQWQHLLMTYDGSAKPSGITISIDGEPVALKVERSSLKGNASIRTKTPLRVGQRSDRQSFEGGSVQDVRIYNRRLSEQETNALANVAPLATVLAIPADKRTAVQQDQLYDHFLATSDSESTQLAARVTAHESELAEIKGRSPITHVQVEKPNSPAMAFILMRGAYDKPGDKVSAKTPAALHPMPEGAPANRLGLARWVVDRANPLTARVTVNRFWQEVFGRGIVATPEDFGVMGAAPTHPDLLDWLALDFQANGWNVKRLFKQMLMSATYRQSARVTDAKLRADRDNALLSRGPRFRMDAEVLRDYALSVSGLLSAKMFGPGTRPYQPENIWDIVGLPGGDTRNYVQDKGENLYRRTLYHFWKRMAPPPSLEAFNAPSREVCTVQRERTNTPLQALVTLNDPQFVEAARVLAQRQLIANQGDIDKTLDAIAKRVLCRPIAENEIAVCKAALNDFRAHYESHPQDATALLTVGETAIDESLRPGELAAWTLLCNQLLNLDEVLTK